MPERSYTWPSLAVTGSSISSCLATRRRNTRTQHKGRPDFTWQAHANHEGSPIGRSFLNSTTRLHGKYVPHVPLLLVVLISRRRVRSAGTYTCAEEEPWTRMNDIECFTPKEQNARNMRTSKYIYYTEARGSNADPRLLSVRVLQPCALRLGFDVPTTRKQCFIFQK